MKLSSVPASCRRGVWARLIPPLCELAEDRRIEPFLRRHGGKTVDPKNLLPVVRRLRRPLEQLLLSLTGETGPERLTDRQLLNRTMALLDAELLGLMRLCGRHRPGELLLALRQLPGVPNLPGLCAVLTEMRRREYQAAYLGEMTYLQCALLHALLIGGDFGAPDWFSVFRPCGGAAENEEQTLTEKLEAAHE